jgi:hypothetical protein
LVLIASNENISAKDRIDAEAASCEVVALAITKLAFEGPIILKGFSAYFCGDDDDLAQLELKNQRLLPLPTRPPEFYDYCFSWISLAILTVCVFEPFENGDSASC